jgi:DNA-binding YbaB/EbfC family protein
MTEDEEEGGPGPTGLGNIADLFAQFEEATERLEAVAEEARSATVEGSAAGGAVVIKLSGDLDAVSVHIDPSLVDPGDVGMLEDSVLAALRDALGQVTELQQEAAGMLAGPEIDLSALLGSLGGLTVPGFGNLANLAELGNLGIPEHMPGGDALGGGLGSLLSGLGFGSGRPVVDVGATSEGDAPGAEADEQSEPDGPSDPDEAAGRA